MIKAKDIQVTPIPTTTAITTTVTTTPLHSLLRATSSCTWVGSGDLECWHLLEANGKTTLKRKKKKNQILWLQ